MRQQLAASDIERGSNLLFQVFALEERAGPCGTIPCSGNNTCLAYSCSYCKENYCVMAPMEEAAPSSSSMMAMMPSATPAAAGGNAAGNVKAAGGAVALAGLGVAALLL